MNQVNGENSNNVLRLSSFELGNHRIDVAAPPKVSASTPILIMHDGANLLLPKSETWNGQNWGIVESLEAGLIAAENLPVVIGVFTGEGTTRFHELSPLPIVEAGSSVFDAVSVGQPITAADITSDAYQDFLANEVLPNVAAKLGIELDPSRTAIGGSSMGGLASIYGLGRHPLVYGTALAFSTHWPFGGEQALEILIGNLPKAGSGHRLWLDSGNQELDAAYPALHYSAIDRLISNGWLRDRDFEARIYAGTGHQEKYWAARWPDAVNWWLSPSPRV